MEIEHLQSAWESARQAMANGRDMSAVVAENLAKQDVTGYQGKIPVFVVASKKSIFSRGLLRSVSKRKHKDRRFGFLYLRRGDSGTCCRIGRLRKEIPWRTSEGQNPRFSGVHCEIMRNQNPVRKDFDPESPLADTQGFVVGSNVDPLKEVLRGKDAAALCNLGINLAKAVSKSEESALKIAGK
ncbi:MAG: hypothetical protein LBJ83_01455 [Oscillospiraceae bacterium]|nr:hypothetical protein [Oscillospiraceae bacterium]